MKRRFSISRNKKTNEHKYSTEKNLNQNKKRARSISDRSIIIRPHITEKSFNMIEKENKIIFITHEKADKNLIKDELVELYEAEIVDVNTARTADGKKAFAKFKNIESARDLATKLGLV